MGYCHYFLMSPRQLKVAACLFALAVAGAVFFLPTGGSYVEYSAVDVAPAARSVVVAPKATVALPLVSPAAQVVPSVEPAKQSAISLGGVTEAMTATKPVAVNQSPSQANSGSGTNVASTGAPVYRPGYLASVAEREAAADLAGIPREDFVKACDRDHDLHLAAGLPPGYFCAGLKAPIGPDVTAVTTTPTYPTTETFILHSRPAATRKIYLDFTGHTTTGTSWNTAFSKATFTTPPFSLDANTAAFSAAEHAAIQYVWRSIAEDFAQFDVDVTTEDPGVDGLKRASTGDASYGMRVVFGPDQNATGSGGQAYVGSFSGIRTASQTDVPCFVYAGTGASAKFMAEAGAHEVGHTVGLFHDGLAAVGTTPVVQYYPGHGTGATSWAPIMGVGYSRDIVQWSKGEYTNANNTQDDISVIGTYLNPIADDHPGTMATATVVTGTTITGGGLINNANDVDMFKINAGRGKLVITPKGVLVSPNLRLQVKVLKSDGTVLNTYDALGTTGKMAPSPITYDVTEDGTYFIQLDGIANGTGLTDGYSDYGSVGIYGLTASWIEPGNKPPIADASLSTSLSYNYQTQPSAAVSFNGSLSSDPDGLVVSYVWNFGDVYPQTASGPIVTHRYLAPGVYKPTLTVIDDRGARSSTQLTVNVTGPVKGKTDSLALNTASFMRVNSVSDAAAASITVQDQYGNPLKGAIVDVTVAGTLTSAPTVRARTDIYGKISVASPTFRRGAKGTVIFTVVVVTSTTHTYVPVDNIPPTSVTISR